MSEFKERATERKQTLPSVFKTDEQRVTEKWNRDSGVENVWVSRSTDIDTE